MSLLKYKDRLTLDTLIYDIPINNHWVGHNWYSDSFPEGSRVQMGYNDIFGIVNIGVPRDKPVYVGIMDIKPHLANIKSMEDNQKDKAIQEAINLAMGNFDRYGGGDNGLPTSRCMVEVTDLQDVEEHWFYHKHEE